MKIEPIYVTDDRDMKRIMELRGKVVELETAMAAKDDALREIEIWCNDHDVSCEMACEESHKIAEAALSPPTGKVLVDVEKLNKLADGFQGTDGFELGLCPVCAKKEFHADDCWLKEYWLKESQ